MADPIQEAFRRLSEPPGRIESSWTRAMREFWYPETLEPEFPPPLPAAGALPAPAQPKGPPSMPPQELQSGSAPVLPGKWQDVQSTSTWTRQNMTPALRAAVAAREAAAGRVGAAYTREGGAAEKAAQGELAGAEEVARGARVSELAQAEKVRNLRADAEQRAREVDAEARALAGAKVDPDRWWGQRSTGQKVLAAIMSGVAGAGAALSGQRNPVLAIIDKAIEDDIAVQRDALGRRERGLGESRGMLAALQGRTERAEDVFRAAAQHRVAAIAAALAAVDQVPLRKAQYERVAAEYLDKAADSAVDIQAKMAGQSGGSRTRQFVQPTPGVSMAGNVDLDTDAGRQELRRQMVGAAMATGDPKKIAEAETQWQNMVKERGLAVKAGALGEAQAKYKGALVAIDRALGVWSSPGVLAQAGRVPLVGAGVRMLSGSAAQARGAYMAALAGFLSALSGATVTPNEAERYAAAYGLDHLLRDPVVGLRWMREQTQASLGESPSTSRSIGITPARGQ